MQVPEHIYVAGDGNKQNSVVSAPPMVVPDKITVARPEGYGRHSPPADSSLIGAGINPATPSNINYSNVEYSSQNSVAVDENPLREIKNIRRQLGRLSTRVMELEDENIRRHSRERNFWLTMGVGGVILALISWLSRQKR